MIEMLEGLPGSGKSYHSVSDYLLPWVRGNRRVYTYIDGFYLDRLAAFEGRPLKELETQITNWLTPEDVFTGLLKVEPGSAVLIDECQTIFRSQVKVPNEILRWLELHRHFGMDVVMVCQDYRQVTSGVTRLVEVTTKFLKLSRVGLGKRYKGTIRGNPEETESIRSFIGKYDAKVYSYYSSYRAVVKEQGRGYSVFKSAVVVGSLSMILVVIFGFNYLMANPLSMEQAQAVKLDAKKLPPPPPLPVLAGVVSSSGAVVPVRVEGSIYDERKGWRYLLEGGRVVSSSELAALSGYAVVEVADKGLKRVEGPGLVWGGLPYTDEELESVLKRKDALKKLVGSEPVTVFSRTTSDHSGEVVSEGSEPEFKEGQVIK
ncbi:MAG: zonular occludens toxin domain-containing protein [Nitrospirota bacterium]|nr:zonular occludens toxin domain-containing protein [Nitrospirota bacterium]